MTNDMENAILNSVSGKKDMKNLSFTERAMKLKTKNLTLAYIKRLFFNIIFDIRKSDVVVNGNSDGFLHAKGKTKLKKFDLLRILGFKKKSSEILKKIKTPVLMSYSSTSYKSFVSKYNKKVVRQNKKGEFILSPILQKNIFANDLYYLLSGEKLCEAEQQVVVK